MKLVSISARNLKGLSFTLALSRMNVLIGSNFAGKTARTDAIRLLLLGYLPELGKLPRATFGLCSGRDLEVSGVFDNGERMSRRWYLKDDSVKSESVIPPSLEDVGDVVSVMLNAETYFGLSDRERVNYVFAHIPNLEAGSDRASIEQGIFGELFNREDLKEDAITEFKGEFRAAARELEDDSPQSFLDWALGWASEQEKSRKTQTVVMTKTAQGLAYLRTQDTVREDELPDVERKIREGNETVAALRDEKGRLSSDVDLMQKNRRRRQVLAAELEARPRLAAQRLELAKKLEALEQAPLPAQNGGEVAHFEERVGMLEHAAARLEGDVMATADLDALRMTDRDLTAKIASTAQELRGVDESLERNRTELRELAGKDRCAYCGATGVAWKTLKTEEINSALAGLTTKRGQLSEHLERLTEHGRQVTKDLAAAKTAEGLFRGKSDELRVAREALASVERTLQSQQTAARRRRDDELKAARDAVAAVDKTISSTEGKAGELAAIPTEEDGTLETRLAEVGAKITSKLEVIAELENRRRAIVGRSHDLRRLAEAEKNRDKSKNAEEVAKAAAAAFRALQGRFVKDAFTPLLVAANRFFGEILKTPLAYNAGEIGTWRDGVWVGHKTFSGAEKRLAYVAIQAALTERAPFRLMLLDELGTIHDSHIPAMTRAIISALIDGNLDQFVGIDLGRAKTYQLEAEFGGIELTLEQVAENAPPISHP